MSSERVQAMLQKAGTVLCNSSGHIYFDLNGKSPADCQEMNDVLQGVARLTNSKIYGDVPHPMTKSGGTIRLDLNVDPANPKTQTARDFRDMLFRTGNAFYYEVGVLHDALSRAAESDEHHKAAFMKTCHKMVAVPHGEEPWAKGRSLAEHIVLAVALNTHYNQMKSVVYVPTNLYSRDSVKAVGVETILRGGAKTVNGQYSQQMMTVYGGDLGDFHVVESEQMATFLLSKKLNSTVLHDHVFASEVQADVIRFSSGPTNLAPLPNVETTGDILADLGIQSVDISTMGNPALGLNLK